MKTDDWKWKVGEAVSRIRTRYEFIGRKSGVPFLAIVYPIAAEKAVFREWHTQTNALRPDIDVRIVDLLTITQDVLTEFGVENIVEALNDPEWGQSAKEDLTRLWNSAIAEAVRTQMDLEGSGRPVLSLERLSALYPVSGPWDIMQSLWNDAQSALNCPVIVFIPGRLTGPRHYQFLEKVDEFMYRGDLL
ncbi:hypothetical protein FGU65_04310 [Methanoculleus sp. FWC-SCC1]|uniref:Uncharacterized protein n=1 Tax=Methanoculleus frigidifontis TaxID=2584085 RepID=A0ABT8M855_9EURY|nr:hypothetical protein [Methanoculleus sp. FWC-SCC1]MDN7024120.1 hypothetical protein [Methanoculleus sp. FWC-SCC1]